MSKLAECHAKKLFPTGKIFRLIVSIVAFNAPFEDIIRGKFNQLGKDHLPFVHP
jgi:hypothetical protein